MREERTDGSKCENWPLRISPVRTCKSSCAPSLPPSSFLPSCFPFCDRTVSTYWGSVPIRTLMPSKCFMSPFCCTCPNSASIFSCSGLICASSGFAAAIASGRPSCGSRWSEPFIKSSVSVVAFGNICAVSNLTRETNSSGASGIMRAFEYPNASAR